MLIKSHRFNLFTGNFTANVDKVETSASQANEIKKSIIDSFLPKGLVSCVR